MTPIEQALQAMRDARDFINIHATWRPPTRYDKLDAAIAALEAEPLAEDAGPLRFDHLGFPYLRGQRITVPLRGEWVAGMEPGTELTVTITRKPE